jgi:hypothetical protein
MQLASAAPTAVRRALRRALIELGYAPIETSRIRRSLLSRTPALSHHRLVRTLRRFTKKYSR